VTGHGQPFALQALGPAEGADILLVDDDPTLRRGLIQALGSAGYSILWATDGKAALELLAARRFRLVITDIYMPNNDGFEVMMGNAALGTGTPVIAMSGGGIVGPVESVLRSATNLGCLRTLEKPFDLADLLGAVREVLT
jgi:DNA-binding NtrC family response regulator